MFKRAIFTTLILALSANAFALPKEISPSKLQNGKYKLVETITINGDIDDNFHRLINRSIKNKKSDYYVIQDLSENTFNDTLTVVVDLYKH
ncbi:hypothetical protein C942_02826 [Photobacterium marinum]|uniref:DUF1471 domain-containing protein n=1 Tax=Photobacterium marinum TaxID=1056511 RepID=L8J9Q6_9GAMM|nr:MULTISPECIES: DUF1471 domain-containing protein [Photobacterium]ELR64244.1 hypothetical protein C942_02826 [Photobacterium marinum]